MEGCTKQQQNNQANGSMICKERSSKQMAKAHHMEAQPNEPVDMLKKQQSAKAGHCTRWSGESDVGIDMERLN
jgi:hypothetical protein